MVVQQVLAGARLYQQAHDCNVPSARCPGKGPLTSSGHIGIEGQLQHDLDLEADMIREVGVFMAGALTPLLLLQKYGLILKTSASSTEPSLAAARSSSTCVGEGLEKESTTTCRSRGESSLSASSRFRLVPWRMSLCLFRALNPKPQTPNPKP